MNCNNISDKGDCQPAFHLAAKQYVCRISYILISTDAVHVFHYVPPQITKVHTFLDYVMGGCQINFTVSN